MTQRISDLMDGEVADADLDQVWKSVSAEGAARETWETYHLIGDCLRGDAPQSGLTRPGSAERLFARLAEEPTVLAPRATSAGAISGRTRVAFAMAASVATLGVVGLIATRAPNPEIAGGQVAVSTPVAVPVQQVANGAPVPQVNDYLAMHRQFAPVAGMQQASMVREVPRKSAPISTGK